jgi:hypothetical protein
MKTLICSLLVAAASFAAQPVENGRTGRAQGSAKHDATEGSSLPIATIRSSGGLVLNGVATPAGVNSVVITRGDVVETLSAPAIMTYRDGKVMTLAPGSKFGVDQRNGLTAAPGAGRSINNPLQINGLSVRR